MDAPPNKAILYYYNSSEYCYNNIVYIGTYNDLNENSGQTFTGCVFNIKYHVFTFFGLFVPTPNPQFHNTAREWRDFFAELGRLCIHRVCVYINIIALYNGIMFSRSSGIITLEFFTVKCLITL